MNLTVGKYLDLNPSPSRRTRVKSIDPDTNSVVVEFERCEQVEDVTGVDRDKLIEIYEGALTMISKSVTSVGGVMKPTMSVDACAAIAQKVLGGGGRIEQDQACPVCGRCKQ